MSVNLAFDNSTAILNAGMIPAPYGASRPRKRPLILGLRYERQCLQAIKQIIDLETGLLAGQWFRYQRRNGESNVCQPDILIVESALIIVIECKNTWVENALEQIALYNEVCERAFSRKAVGFQMCKNISQHMRGRISRDFDSAVSIALGGGMGTLHWSGKSQL